MSKPNGRQQKAIEGLAAALNECFGAATERSEKAVEHLRHDMNTRLDKQDATLRLMWNQSSGDPNQRLPIDD